MWRELGEPDSLRFLDALPFTAFRTFVQSQSAARNKAPAPSDRFDRNASIVHIWGPVMVIPFLDGNEALHAIELIGHDPAASDVSVVVVDLSGVIVDDGFSAAALEQVVDTIEAWGAEAIFASVSPLSESVVAELGRQPWLIYGLLRIVDGSSPLVSSGNALFTLIGFLGMYFFLGLLFLFLVFGVVNRGPAQEYDQSNSGKAHSQASQSGVN